VPKFWIRNNEVKMSKRYFTSEQIIGLLRDVDVKVSPARMWGRFAGK
jgi:hypothetical protein